MAIAFVQSWNYDDGNNTPSHSYTISGATAGNRLFAALVGRVHRTVSTPPTGWYEEEIRSTAVDDPSPIIVYSRVATGDSNDNFSITMSGNITLAFVAAEYSGVDSTAAAIAEATDVTRELIDNTTNTSVTTGTVTPSTGDGMFILVGAVEAATVYSGASETVSGYTFRVYEDQSSISTGYPGIWLFDHIISGSSGETATFTSSTPTGTTSSATILVYVPPAAGGGVSVEPGQANLALSTTAPTVQAGTSADVQPSAANLALTATAPSVTASDNVALAPAAADLSLSATAPDVASDESVNRTVPSTDLALTTQAPAVVTTDNRSIEVPVINLSLSSIAPAVTQGFTITPPGAALVLSSVAPTLVATDNKAITVDKADLALSASAPTALIAGPIAVSPAAANLTLTGYAPTSSDSGSLWTEIAAVSTTWTEI